MQVFNQFKTINLLFNKFIIIFSIIFIVFSDIYLVVVFILVFIIFQSFVIKEFKLTDNEFIISFPIRLIKKKIVYKWKDITEIRIKEYGSTGYGSSPYLDIYHNKAKNGKWDRVFFHTMNKDEIKKFTEVLTEKLPKDKLVVNSY